LCCNLFGNTPVMCDVVCVVISLIIKGILGFLVDNIYVVFGDQVFQQSVYIPMGTNCAPSLADLFLYSYEAEFVQKLLQDNNKKTSRVLQPYI
jgi:hypothetical protein